MPAIVQFRGMEDRLNPVAPEGTDEGTLGGYRATHGRSPAFEGSDGLPYTVAVETDAAEDGQAALLKLERVSAGGYQIVISDILMPRCSGDQLHDWLADHRPDLFVRLILITGDLTSPILGDFIARTPRPVIAKPFDLTELAAMVEAVLSGR